MHYSTKKKAFYIAVIQTQFRCQPKFVSEVPKQTIGPSETDTANLRISSLIHGHRTGDMEDPLARGQGRQRVGLEHVGLEQAQVLRCPFQPGQVSVLWDHLKWHPPASSPDQEQQRSGGVLGNGYGREVLRLHGSRTVACTASPRERRSLTSHEAMYPPPPVTHTRGAGGDAMPTNLQTPAGLLPSSPTGRAVEDQLIPCAHKQVLVAYNAQMDPLKGWRDRTILSRKGLCAPAE
jgi:hypothetical protein